MILLRQRASIALVLASTFALGGCATRWVVDSQVRSFSELPADTATARAPMAYRFERLPLQQQGPEAARQTDALEAFAMPALDAAGLRRDDAGARYSVQIGARVTRVLSPWDDPWLNGGWGGWGGWGYGRPYYGGYGGYGGWGRRGGFGAWGGGFGGFAPMANPWYAREVSVVMRDLGTQRVVYETHARNDGPYSGDAAVLPAMFQAALRGFPTPPQGVRRVDVEIRRAGAPAAP